MSLLLLKYLYSSSRILTKFILKPTIPRKIENILCDNSIYFSIIIAIRVYSDAISVMEFTSKLLKGHLEIEVFKIQWLYTDC